MAKKKACKKCRMLFDGAECPACKANISSTTWHGRLYILDVQHSTIAQKCGFENKGEYAIKIR